MESYIFTVAVRGYHYYRRFWRPKENEKLVFLHGPGNTWKDSEREWRNRWTLA